MNELELAKQIAEELDYYYNTYSNFCYQGYLFQNENSLYNANIDILDKELIKYGFRCQLASDFLKQHPNEPKDYKNPSETLIAYSESHIL